MCCSLSGRSCLTQVSTAWKTFSSLEMLSWLLEISCSTCQEHTQAESERLLITSLLLEKGVYAKMKIRGADGGLGALPAPHYGKRNYKELSDQLWHYSHYFSTRIPFKCETVHGLDNLQELWMRSTARSDSNRITGYRVSQEYKFRGNLTGLKSCRQKKSISHDIFIWKMSHLVCGRRGN